MVFDDTTIAAIISIVWIVVEFLGMLAAVHAVFFARTSQSAIAWAFSLVTLPWITLPVYLIVGRHRFRGYLQAMAQAQNQHAASLKEIMFHMKKDRVQIASDLKLYEKLGVNKFKSGHQVKLLIDGAATFGEMFEDIMAAKEYVLLQYFIVKDDNLGRQFQDILKKKARQGVRIYLLFDEIGSYKLPRSFIAALVDAGVIVSGFKTTRGSGNRFQVNFRNHRKITVIDGQLGYLGGHNVGDDYMGRNPKIGRWRDTHLKIQGPAVRDLQLSFMSDWYWATRKQIKLSWSPVTFESSRLPLLILPTGPIQDIHMCSHLYVHAVHSAKKRFWLAGPYFVPSDALVDALQIAALRGVDVRIMLPNKPDHRIVYLASFSFLEHLHMKNISIYRYDKGFLHQKVMLVDDALAMVGTANADHRSFELNFEITAIVADAGFAGEVSKMFETDFSHCRKVINSEFENRSVFFKTGVKIARLFSPLL